MLFLIAYALIALVGLIPANRNFQPAADGVEVFFVSSAIHADVILPLKTHTMDWRKQFPAECFRGNVQSATHVAIGWGDKGFFLDTPTWADLKASTASKALLLPSETCMHVSMTSAPLIEDAQSTKISAQQYERLVSFILASFQRDPQQRNIQIPEFAYGTNDAFFEAHGTYHCLNTCNSWTGAAMRQAGIKTPWLTPMPKSMFLYMPD